MNINRPEYQRNFGFWSEEEQARIAETTVAMAGVGGDGYQLAEKFARIGIEHFVIADPEVFEAENANRVPGATTKTYGSKKVKVLEEKLYEINPKATLRSYDEGITVDNVEEFVRGADVIFDETELTMPHLGTSIARVARKLQIPVAMVMNIGFAGQVNSFDPNSKMTFERLMGLPENAPIDEIAEMEVDFTRCLPYIPSYADLRTLESVMKGSKLPSIAPGVDVACALGQTEALKHIFAGSNRRKQPTWAPKFVWQDAYSHVSGSTSHPKFSFYRGVASAAIREKLGLNPRAAYTLEDIERRTAAAVEL